MTIKHGYPVALEGIPDVDRVVVVASEQYATFKKNNNGQSLVSVPIDI